MKKYLKSLSGLLASIALVTSCYDDSKLWESITQMEDRITALEESLNSQVQAMAALLSDGSTIKSCVLQKDGSYLVTLSDDTKFSVLPQGTDYSALLTYRTVDGKKYWALFNPSGEAELLMDASNKPIPVETKVEVKVNDGKYYLVINGVEYQTGFDASDVIQVFESCTPHKDASGNVYAMTFTFGDGLQVTVSVDGYKGVVFKIANASSSFLISEYYIPYGKTQSILLDLEGVVDYALQIPYGWKVVEKQDELTGDVYLDITAPSETLVESGAAFEGGDLKAVAVVEGGDAAISKLVISAEPFKTLEFSSTRLIAEPYDGLVKFAYGLMTLGDYDEQQVIANVEKMLTTNADYPAGYNVSEVGINLPVSEILGSEINTEERYVVFVLPVMYDESLESMYYVLPEMLESYEFGAILVNMSEPVPSLFDAEITVEVKGTDKMWAGTVLKQEGVVENIVYSIANGILDPVSEPLVYSGKASAFPTAEANEGVEFLPSTTYLTWCVPFDPEKQTYTEDDVVYREFTTSPLVSGGSIELTVGEPAIDATSISVDLSAPEAEAIYYAYLTNDEGSRLGAVEGMDDVKFDLIRKSASCTVVKGTEAVAAVDNLMPELTMWLYAVAVDADGKYGDVKCVSCTLPKVQFNSITLSIADFNVGSDNATFTVAATGGTPVSYIYWIGTMMDPFWVKCGKIRTTAEKYMAVYPDDESIERVMSANGEIGADGVLNVSGLRMEEDYVLMILAKDESGKYSKGVYKKITTLAADLGDVVVEGSEKWESARNSIKIDWITEAFMSAESQGLMSQYAFNFSCPDNLTAYVMCASDTYFADAGLTKMAHIMIEIENSASRKYDNGRTVEVDGESLCEPDYYKNGEHRSGQMMNVYDFYVHGLPNLGFVTYFAKDSHGEGNCIYWENGVDVNYQRALKLIAEYCTLAPYQRRAEAFGLEGDEASDWADALLAAYLPYYQDAKPIIFENDGTPIRVTAPYATGVNDKGVIPDRVVVMLKEGKNYFEPMYFEVPNYFDK